MRHGRTGGATGAIFRNGAAGPRAAPAAAWLAAGLTFQSSASLNVRGGYRLVSGETGVVPAPSLPSLPSRSKPDREDEGKRSNPPTVARGTFPRVARERHARGREPYRKR